MTQEPNPFHQKSLQIDPEEQIFLFRQAQRRNQPKLAVKPLMKFIRHYQISGQFHQYSYMALKTWLSLNHGVKGDVLSGVEVTVHNWWSPGTYEIQGSNSYDSVTYAMLAGILTIKKDSCVYPGPEFPCPDQNLADYLTQARKKHREAGPTYDYSWTPIKKDPSDWNGSYPP